MAIHTPGRRLMHHVSLKFVQKKVHGGGHRSVAAALNLTSMIDYLVTVVIFLLMSFSASGETPVNKTIRLPGAENTTDMTTAPMVAINGKQILLNEHSVANTVDVDESTNPIILDGLKLALKQLREDWQKNQPGNTQFPGIVILQIDMDVKAIVVKSVFMTAASAGYPNISFMVGNLGKPSAAKGGGGE
jgi:biopolymer transport protein ExbD